MIDRTKHILPPQAGGDKEGGNFPHPTSPASGGGVVYWLSFCIFLVFLMVVVGGLTRLTESGLSIVEWKPVRGTLPPLTLQAWQEEFKAYRQTPQYKKINKGMTLAEFKNIFWLEYIHRLLGRIAGIVFFGPLLWFWLKKQLPPRLALRLVFIFLLGGLQGALGWYMVQSGLVDDPAVSPLRLAAHLGLALIIFGALLWTLLDCLDSFPPSSKGSDTHIGPLAHITLMAIFIQALLGALVAGLDAGLVYNTFPLMNGKWVPDGLIIIEPWFNNLYQNPTTAQFNHRLGALVLCMLILLLWFRIRLYSSDSFIRAAASLLLITLAVQIGLGIATLLYGVPIILASLHQACAVLLFGLAVILVHRLRPVSSK